MRKREGGGHCGERRASWWDLWEVPSCTPIQSPDHQPQGQPSQPPHLPVWLESGRLNESFLFAGAVIRCPCSIYKTLVLLCRYPESSINPKHPFPQRCPKIKSSARVNWLNCFLDWMTEFKFMKGFCEEVTELYAPSSQAAVEEDRRSHLSWGICGWTKRRT